MALAGTKPLDEGVTYDPAPNPITTTPSPTLAAATPSVTTTPSTPANPLASSGQQGANDKNIMGALSTGTGLPGGTPAPKPLPLPKMSAADVPTTPAPTEQVPDWEKPQQPDNGVVTVNTDAGTQYRDRDGNLVHEDGSQLADWEKPQQPDNGVVTVNTDAGTQYRDRSGNIVDKDGNLVDKNGNPVTKDPVTEILTNSKGERIDKNGNVVPETKMVGPGAPTSQVTITDANGNEITQAQSDQMDAANAKSIADAKAVQDQFDALHAEIKKVTENMLNPQDDPQFKMGINKMMIQYGLNNQAGRDALQMQINSDPSLKGMGAGQAMLAMMTRDQNFSQDQAFASLASDSQQRLINMQQFGIQQATQMERDQRTNTENDAATMLKSGNFAGAAATYNKLFAQDGIAMTIDPNVLASKDPDTITAYSSQMSHIADLAKTDPAGAKDLLEKAMANPLFKNLWPEGETADQVIQNLTDVNLADNIANASTIEDNVNTIAANPDATFNATIDGKIQSGIRLQGGDPTKLGLSLFATPNDVGAAALKEINAGRAADDQVTAQGGQLFDKLGLMDDKAVASLYSQKIFTDKQNAAVKANPVDKSFDILSKNPGFSQYFQTPGEISAVKNWLATALAGGSYTISPTDGMPTLTASGQFPWDDPKTAYLFEQWPMATFAADGTTSGTTAQGGLTYGTLTGRKNQDGSPVLGKDGQPETVTADPYDTNLNTLYSNYLMQNKNAPNLLNAKEWYYASAGGTKGGDGQPALDPTKIPAGVMTDKTKEDFTQVGLNGDGAGTPTTTTTTTTTTPTGVDPITGEVKTSFSNKAKALSDAIINNSGSNLTSAQAVDMSNTLETRANDSLLKFKDVPETGLVELGRGYAERVNGYKDASDSLNKLYGLPDTQASGLIEMHSTGGGTFSDKTYSFSGTKAFNDYSMFHDLTKSGISDADAMAMLKPIIGDDGINGINNVIEYAKTKGQIALGGYDQYDRPIKDGTTLPLTWAQFMKIKDAGGTADKIYGNKSATTVDAIIKNMNPPPPINAALDKLVPNLSRLGYSDAKNKAITAMYNKGILSTPPSEQELKDQGGHFGFWTESAAEQNKYLKDHGYDVS